MWVTRLEDIVGVWSGRVRALGEEVMRWRVFENYDSLGLKCGKNPGDGRGPI